MKNFKNVLYVFLPLLILSTNFIFSPTVYAASIPQGLSPSQIKKAYNLPATGGTGTIAIVDALNDPTIESDLAMFSQTFNLPQCTVASGCLTIEYAQGTVPASSNAAISEISLDVEWVHAIAPNAHIRLIEAKSTQVSDLIPAIDLARSHPDVVAISMSWGVVENPGFAQFDSHFVSQTGASFFASSGDTGHNGGLQWPANSPNVIAVGGTTLHFDGAGNVTSETGWSGSTGGISSYVAEPGFQSGLNIANTNGRRGVPDISFDADPNNSGVSVYVNGQWLNFGGTSLAAPIAAGLRALQTTPISNAVLYSNAKNNYSFYYRDITSGNNGNCAIYCAPTTGYDFVTGLGSLITLPQQTPSPTPSPTPTPTPTPSPTAVPTDTIAPLPTSTPIPTPTPTIPVITSPTVTAPIATLPTQMVTPIATPLTPCASGSGTVSMYDPRTKTVICITSAPTKNNKTLKTVSILTLLLAILKLLSSLFRL